MSSGIEGNAVQDATSEPTVEGKLRAAGLQVTAQRLAVMAAVAANPHATTDELVDVARGAPDGTVEVKLAPEELGRVHMTVSQSEADVTITVVVERPETLDLMRRHADILSTELRQAGFERLSFSFGQGGDPNNTGQDTSAAPFEAPDIPSDPDPTDTPTSTHGAAPLALGSTRLDIRL